LNGQEDSDGQKTEGMRNGRWWKAQEFVAKYHYLVGVMDCAGYVLTKPDFKTKNSVAESLRVYNIRYREIVDEIDKFYSSEALNARVPVAAAVTSSTRRQPAHRSRSCRIT